MDRESYKSGLISPIITPRFVPTCTSELMHFLGKLASKYDLHIQSHISENKEEILWVSEIHPECKSYSDVYEKHGLLNDKTIMAHAVYLTPEEKSTFVNNRVGIAHCPLSNIGLNSGFMPVRELLERGVKIGLGTDVSGGYSPSMLNAMRMAIAASSVYTVNHQIPSLNFKNAFYLATLGGSQLINSEQYLGNFVVGKNFDALLVDPTCQDSPFDVFDETLEQIFEKFIYLGDDRNIKEIYVQGKQINY